MVSFPVQLPSVVDDANAASMDQNLRQISLMKSHVFTDPI